jgi:hypothetical protein
MKKKSGKGNKKCQKKLEYSSVLFDLNHYS